MPQQGEKGDGQNSHYDVVPTESAEIKQGWRDGQHQAGQNCSGRPQLVAQEKGKEHQGGTKQDVSQPGGKVGIAEEAQE